MSSTKYLKGECSHCGGHLEFPAEAAGMTTDCPHCGQKTELLLAQPKDDSGIPARVIVWTIITVLILLAGLAAGMYAVKRAQRMVEGKKGGAIKVLMEPIKSNSIPTNSVSGFVTPEAIAKADFRISEPILDKAKGSSLTYAVGTLENLSNKTRYGVKLEFEVLDSTGKKIGDASDYKDTVEPNAKWNFHAPVVATKAAGVRVIGVSEQQ